LVVAAAAGPASAGEVGTGLALRGTAFFAGVFMVVGFVISVFRGGLARLYRDEPVVRAR